MADASKTKGDSAQRSGPDWPMIDIHASGGDGRD
jgi:hypothetical protein